MTAPGQADERLADDVIRERAIRGGAILDEASNTPRSSARFYGEEFDVWLAARDRAVREAALEQGVRWATLHYSPYLSPPPGEDEIREVVRAAANQTGEQKK